MDESKIQKLQAATGIAFGSYAALHLITICSSHFGESSFNTLLNVFRKYYHAPPVEIVILGSLGVHIAVSLYRGYSRWRKQQQIAQAKLQSDDTVKKSSVSGRSYITNTLSLHRYTGYVLVTIIGGHILATRGVSYFHGVYPDFSFVTLSLKMFPYKSFYIYYAVFGISGLYHLSFGLLQSSKIFDLKLPQPSRKTFLKAMGVGALVLCSSILALGGNYFPVSIAKTEFISAYDMKIPAFARPYLNL